MAQPGSNKYVSEPQVRAIDFLDYILSQFVSIALPFATPGYFQVESVLQKGRQNLTPRVAVGILPPLPLPSQERKPPTFKTAQV